MTKHKKSFSALLVVMLAVALIALAISAVALDGKEELRAQMAAQRASLTASAAQSAEQPAMKAAQADRPGISATSPDNEEIQAALAAKAAEQAAIEAKLAEENARGAAKSSGGDERLEALVTNAVPNKKPYDGPPNIPNPGDQRQGGEDIATATVIPSVPYSDTGHTTGYNNDYDEVCPYTGSTAPDVVYSYACPSDMTVDISLCNGGTDYDTKLYLYQDSYTPGAPYACNDDACPGYISEILGLALYGGHTYYIVIDGYGGSYGNYEMTISAFVPCVVECPTGGIDEGEPCIGDDEEDVTNGGCNSVPPVFGSIECGETICGEWNTYLYTGLSYRDTDWYTFTLTQYSIVTITAVGEFPLVTGFLEQLVPGGGWDCGNFTGYIAPYATGDPCDTVVVSQIMAAGDYAIFVGGTVYSGYDCSLGPFDYTVSVTCEPITEGACCYDDGSCVPDMEEAACYTSGGSSWLGGLSCDPNPCPQEGDNCENPIKVELPTRSPWDDLNQTTCGRGNDYDATCLGYYDGGEDIIYEITVLSPIQVDITLDPKGTTWTGFAIATDCPPTSCLTMHTSSAGDPHGVTCVPLDPGVYYLMVDTWPSPDCIPDFDLHITPSQDCEQIENDFCADATPIGEVVDLPFTTDGATFDGPGGCQTSANIWYCYTASETGAAVISLCGSSYDTKMAVYDGCQCWGTMLACNDDACGLQSEAVVPVTSGSHYLIEVGGYGTNVGPGILNIYFQQPCELECPPGAFMEPEDCGDDTNGGCNMPVPAFTPIECGQTVCGTIWADLGTRDTDWYELVLTEANLVTWTGEACFPFVIGFVDTSDCNLAGSLSPYATGDPETVISCSRICGPGVYWLFASHQDFYDQPCGLDNDYWCEVTCEVVTEGACCYDDGSCVPGMEEAACYTSGGTSWLGGQGCSPNLCPQPPYECPPGATMEPEDCGDDTNGGCNSVPPVFGEISCGETICAEAWADADYRDTDWFTLVIDENMHLIITGKGGFPLQVLLIGSTGDCGSYSVMSYFQVAPGIEGTIDIIVAPGIYWVWGGTMDFSGYPCATGPWKYHVKVECEPVGAIYCPASGGGWEYICNVAVGDINNPSGYVGYEDYTALSTTMDIGTGYTITVDNCNSWSSDVCGTWVDWNQDMDFDDANEYIPMTGVGGGVDQFTGTITPPPDALPGPTRMRTRIVDSSVDPLGPCGSTSYGEVEDYTVNVGGEVPPTYLFEPDPVLVLYKYAIPPMGGAIYLSSDALGGDPNDVTDVSLQVEGCSVCNPCTFEVIPGGYGELTGDVLKITFNIADYITCEEENGLVFDQIDSFFDVFFDVGSGSFSGKVVMIGHTSGDLNLDGKVNIGDLTYLVNYLFRSGPAPQVMELADMNASGSVNVADVTYLVNYLFRGGPAPIRP
jgi:TPR repeat protein